MAAAGAAAVRMKGLTTVGAAVNLVNSPTSIDLMPMHPAVQDLGLSDQEYLQRYTAAASKVAVAAATKAAAVAIADHIAQNGGPGAAPPAKSKVGGQTGKRNVGEDHEDKIKDALSRYWKQPAAKHLSLDKVAAGLDINHPDPKLTPTMRADAAVNPGTLKRHKSAVTKKTRARLAEEGVEVSTHNAPAAEECNSRRISSSAFDISQAHS